MSSRPSKLVAIHQPNFLPWLGYFDKILRSDIFVIFDDAQFPKTGGTWINRVRWLQNGEPRWATVPILRSYHGTRAIKEIEIDDRQPWRRKLLGALQSEYGRHPFYREVLPLLESVLDREVTRLAEFNLGALEILLDRLSVDREKVVLASTLGASGSATDRLVSLVRAVGGDAYLCGGGAQGYQEDQKFSDAGIGLHYQNFRHPEYPQVTTVDFKPGLSIVDALMACGIDGTRELLSTAASESKHASTR